MRRFQAKGSVGFASPLDSAPPDRGADRAASGTAGAESWGRGSRRPPPRPDRPARRRRWLWPLGLLAAIHILVLGAGFFAPYNPARQFRDFPYAPPMVVHWRRGRLVVYPWLQVGEQYGPPQYQADRAHPLPLRFFVHGHLFSVRGGQVFLLGTDGLGRDELSRLLYGGRLSLLAGLLGAALALGLGLGFGGAAGLMGGWTDAAVMRGAEVFLALPWIYLLFAARAFLPLTLSAGTAFLLLIAILGLTGWGRPARLIRGVARSARERDYVRAARGFGASRWYLLRRHIWPETYSVALTQAALLAPQFILAEVALAFLGLGAAPPTASWGTMLAGLQKLYVLEAYGWLFAPAVALVIVFALYDWLATAVGREA